jgi:small subunit ribosomal protein S17
MRSLIGTVVSNKPSQTAIVRVDSVRESRLYRKKYKVSRKIAVHDPEDKAVVGTLVRITEIPPISKTKHFLLSEVLTEEKAKK